jgi:phosphoribosylformylglycinamidine synthase
LRAYLGGPALSPFRLRKIEERWVPDQIRLADARFLYLTEKDSPGAAFEEQLMTLLGGARNISGALPDPPRDLIIVPRLGTVSPWSSKATDILERTGLANFGRIERGVVYQAQDPLSGAEREHLAGQIADPLTESVLPTLAEARLVFKTPSPRPLEVVPLLEGGGQALWEADRRFGLGLADRDATHLLAVYRRLGRNPTDAELMMWAQIHSEHCRHHLFHSPLEAGGQRLGRTLFSCIRETYRSHHGPVLLAYRDNAAVIRGGVASRLGAGVADRVYRVHREPVHGVIKVETHNHPTAIAPFPGAATGSGGEIRDEAATGRGGRPRAGLCGFTVSDLHLPGLPRSWERKDGVRVPGLATAFEIMRDGPIGAASYNNEFGRPNLAGYFRSFEAGPDSVSRAAYGYFKPVMLAGGIGSLRGLAWRKRRVGPGLAIIVLGGPGFLIGLGGGSQSSRGGGLADGLDWASVQRGNPEMERRTQEVIDRLVALGPDNPVVAIHDVGAGGLANAVPELIWSGRVGAVIDLGAIPRGDPSLSPMELWCNESQERYVLALVPGALPILAAIAGRERCPWARIGETTAEPRLVVRGRNPPECAIDLDLAFLFRGMRRRRRKIEVPPPPREETDGLVWSLPVSSLLREVLKAPAVGDKSFLVTIADRTVGGLSLRDPMVGPYQVPVADVAVVARDFAGLAGDAFALGERPPVALIDPAASARLAAAEALTNLMAASLTGPEGVALSANWMAASGDAGEEGALYAAVDALSACARAWGIPIPVGKDSLSMRVRLREEGRETEIRSPVTVVVSAFGSVTDVRRTLTPVFDLEEGAPVLILVELTKRRGRLGGSTAAQVMGQLGALAPDLEDPGALIRFWRLLTLLRERGWIRSYHDRSDGGAWVAALEMAFASRAGLDFETPLEGEALLRFLLDEAPGAIVAVDPARAEETLALFEGGGLSGQVHRLAEAHAEDRIRIRAGSRIRFEASRSELRRIWSETTYAMKRLRDDPESAAQEEAAREDPDRYRLWASPPPPPRPSARPSRSGQPRVAVLREQGVNGQMEMAAAFMAAGFRVSDVHMSDLVSGDETLESYDVMAACGGFSYGDVLGAGAGWAQAIRFDPRLREGFRDFFARPGTLALGVCNGCQMFARLRDLIPGAEDWPQFGPNRSEQFEARLTMVRVGSGPSPWLAGLAGGEWPIVVSHGEGRAEFAPGTLDRLRARGGIALEYLSGRGEPTEDYPANPNGSPAGATAFTNRDGRVLIAMPHFERSFRTVQLSWHPEEWGEPSPWAVLFDNARRFVQGQR